MGAAENLKPEDFYWPADNHSVHHRSVLKHDANFDGIILTVTRNGRTGELLVSHFQNGKSKNAHKKCKELLLKFDRCP
jgi:hypothetical protein